MPEIKQIKLQHRTSSGRLREEPALIEIDDGRVYFLKSPFACKDDIKSMKGSKWHQYLEEGKHAGQKIWSIEDCNRNRVNLAFMMGLNPLEWFDRELIRHEYTGLCRNGEPASLMAHQADLADHGLTYHYQIWGAEMGVGKTLAAQMVMEKSGKKKWWWVGPKTSIPNIKREFRIWHFPSHEIEVEFLTYEGLVRRMDEWKPGDEIPDGVIFDESSRLKTATAQRTKAAQMLADLIRDKYGYDGYVIEMSGTPSPKSPLDWWAQCEIAWPGFLKEGSPKALEQRLAFLVKQEYDSGSFFKRVGWRDDERKCEECGELECHDNHNGELVEDPEDFHEFKPSTNEVAFMYERLKGLVVIKHKKDCLQLPEKRYRKVICKPNASTLRVAKAVVDSAVNAVTGMTLLRELSDGFQYREQVDGTTRCTHCTKGKVEEWFDTTNPDQTYADAGTKMLDPETFARLQKREVDCPVCGGSCEVPKHVRITREVPCPKDAALKLLLEENEEVGRIVIFAAFTGSVDRVMKLCQSQGWDVVKCDGRGFAAFTHDNAQVTDAEPLDYWANLEAHPRVAFVAHPESGGMSLTLTEARMAVYWSNSLKPEYRVQSEDRIHRKGMDENLGCTIVDLIHLPSDQRALDVIRANRKLELMTMGEVMAGVNWDEPEGSEEGFQIEEQVAA
jgi:hypothetical protein